MYKSFLCQSSKPSKRAISILIQLILAGDKHFLLDDTAGYPGILNAQDSLMNPSKCSNDYLCVSCLTPNNALYRQYSSIKSIKLQTCTNCGRDIDPYIERELLLVVIDMVLLRSSAYTHFLFNRKCYIQALQQRQEHKTNGGKYGYNLLFNSLFMMIMAIFLKTMIQLKEKGVFVCSFDRDESCPVINHRQLLHAFLWSVFHLGWLVCTSYVVARFILSFEHSNGRSRCDSSNRVRFDDICLSIFIPQIFHLVTLFVHMYEDSSGIRLLGSTFVACFHYYSLICIIDGTMAKMNENVNIDVLRMRRLRWIGKCMVALTILISLGVNHCLLAVKEHMRGFTVMSEL